VDSGASFDEAKQMALQWAKDAATIHSARIDIHLLIEKVDDHAFSKPALKNSNRCIIF